MSYAQEIGVDTFCHWHYWFSGRRLLHRPLDDMIRIGRNRVKFMLGWANESWTGIWHGAASRVLVEQKYNREELAAAVDSSARGRYDRLVKNKGENEMSATEIVSTIETQTISIKLEGEVRTITVERFSPQHCWFVSDGTMITARFKTGTKVQVIGRPQVIRRNDGTWFFPPQYCHNRNITPTGWYDAPTERDSKW